MAGSELLFVQMSDSSSNDDNSESQLTSNQISTLEKTPSSPGTTEQTYQYGISHCRVESVIIRVESVSISVESIIVGWNQSL